MRCYVMIVLTYSPIKQTDE